MKLRVPYTATINCRVNLQCTKASSRKLPSRGNPEEATKSLIVPGQMQRAAFLLERGTFISRGNGSLSSATRLCCSVTA